MRENRCRRLLMALAQPQGVEAHGVIAARFNRHVGIGVAAGPRFNAGVEIQRAAFARQLNERGARHVHREIQQEIAGIQSRLQNLPVVLGRQRCLDEFHAEFPGLQSCPCLRP